MSTKILEPNQVDIIDDKVVIGSTVSTSSQEKKPHTHFHSLNDFADTPDDQDNGYETQNNISKHIGHGQKASSYVTEDHSTLNMQPLSDTHTEKRIDNTDVRHTPAHKDATVIEKNAHVQRSTHRDDTAGMTSVSAESSNMDDDIVTGGDVVHANNNEFDNTNSTVGPASSSTSKGSQELSNIELRNTLSEKEITLAELQNKNSELQRQIEEAQKSNAANTKREHYAAEERKHILRSAQEESDKIIADAQARSAEVNKSAYEKGYAAGKEEGFSKGYESVEALIVRMREITGKILQKRKDIMEEMESQVIDLVVLIAKKVIKIISKESKDIIVENVQHALAMVRKKGEIIIRINPIDLNISSDYLKKMTDSIEHEGTIQFIEDGLIERGGCVVESEFGEIDARIHSQILEMENKIRA